MKKITLLLASIVLLAACGRSGSMEAATREEDVLAPTPPPEIPSEPTEAFLTQLTKPLTVVDALVIQGYKFVLVATKNNTDQVLVNEDANNLEFNVGETVCRIKILTKADPTYQGEELGVLQVVCDNHGVKLTSSASCSPRYPEVQSHFEIADDQDKYVLDLICRVTPPPAQ